jgi:hypothetical protein
MIEIIKYIFSSFWVFLGVLILISLILTFIANMHNRFWRHFNIRKHGYPPAHCDADGDFKETTD